MAYTNIDDPSAYFQTAIYNGSNSLQAITNDGNSDLKPDWLWIKHRNGTENHMLVDSTRGKTKYLLSDSNIAEQTVTSRVETFDTDGFTVNGSSNPVNALGGTYVAWQWKANGGTTSSNTDGDITSIVQVNQDAGFSIMTYSGTTGDVHTIGHGLGVTPQVWIVKQRSGNSEFQDWFFWHHQMAASNIIDNRMLFLNSTAAIGTYTGINAVTSSTIRVKSSTTAQNGDTYVAYAFAEKQGYSKFGSYIGNGNADGPFVYTGFKPAFVMLKRTNTTSNWIIMDSKRNAFNEMESRLFPNLANAEQTQSTYGLDFLSNGFKLRDTVSQSNGSGSTYIYMAFAENPFTTSTGIPTTAR
jgi:hypothetical protein